MINKQKKYSGRLSLEEIAEGISACLQNARTLIKDATILLWARRYPRALTCLLVAKEELGKVDVLGAMARTQQQDHKRWADIWKSFRHHKAKGAHAAIQTAPDQLRTSFDSIFSALPVAFQIATFGEESRQASLYVDFSESGRRWISPSDIDRAIVKQHLASTRTVLKRLEYYYKAGLFSVQALTIQHEEMSAAISSLSPSKNLTYGDLKALEAPVKQCIIRLIRELGIRYPDNVTIMGKPWRQFIED